MSIMLELRLAFSGFLPISRGSPEGGIGSLMRQLQIPLSSSHLGVWLAKGERVNLRAKGKVEGLRHGRGGRAQSNHPC